MTLRLATPADAAGLAALSIEVWVGTYLRHGIGAGFADYALTHFTKARFQDWIAAPDETLILSENRDGVDGYLRLSAGRALPTSLQTAMPDLSASDPPETEISTLYVQPRHQGKGIGQALLRHALALCANRGEAQVWLMANSENTPALAFYDAWGARRIGRTDFHLGDQRYPNTVFLLTTEAKAR